MGSGATTELTSAHVGGRIRSLRKSIGMSQAELAGDRFSKEYVSQIERGKTQPTRDTLEWLADRLATDRQYLENGVSEADAERVERAVRDAELAVQAHRYDEALAGFRHARQLLDLTLLPSLSLRALMGEAWARMRTGDLDGALSVLDDAQALVETAKFSDVDRANVVFHVGVCRYSLSSIEEATALFDGALVVAERSGLPCDGLRSDILHWRSRCHRRTRDWVAAGEDIERALELAEGLSDSRRIADACFQASLVAQREGRWIRARSLAERAKTLFDELGDRATVGRLLNNLAGLNHLLGDRERAISLLREAFAIFVEVGLAVDAGYVCASLAEIQLGAGDFEQARVEAEKALELLAGRVDHLQEIGTAQLVLGRALAAEGNLREAQRLIETADRTFERASSLSHRSDAWVAYGDLALQRGEDRAAAAHYRRAALSLLDTR